MSVIQVLYPKTATKDALRRYILSEGFTKSDPFIVTWPDANSYYYWYDSTDFRSTVGIDAIIFKVGEKDRQRWKAGEWGLYTRSRVGRSSFDADKQNQVIRSARKLFGGSFLNDGFGTNVYIPVRPESTTPMERGLRSLFLTISEDLSMLDASLPPERPFPRRTPRKIVDILNDLDPSRRLYSALAPFVLAALERFFRDAFTILLKYDHRAQQRLWSEARRIDFSELMNVVTSQKTVEDIVASWYSFQNLNSIHVAFKEWLGIDFWSIIRQHKKVGDHVVFIEAKLKWMIEYRHGVIHNFRWERAFGKESIEEMIAVTQKVIELFLEHLELERNMQIVHFN
jgi:hypothetical protein